MANTVRMQAPAGGSQVIATGPLQTGQKYTPDANGIVTVDPKDVGVLIAAGYTLLDSLAIAKYATGALQSATFAAGDLTGAQWVNYENTGTTPGNLATRTAAQMFADFAGAYLGLTYMLAIRNSAGGANTATITAGTGVTLSGTMTIAQNVTRLFSVTFNTDGTVTIRSMGILAAGA